MRRRPLVFAVLCEVVVCLALGFAAWHLFTAPHHDGAVAAAGAGVPGGGGPGTAPGSVAVPPAPGSAGVPGSTRSSGSGGSRPGLGAGRAFLSDLLRGINADDAAFERAEWEAVRAVTAALKQYLESVVVPAVEKAAHGRAAAR